MPPQLVAIAAVARNGVIGAENGLPWRVSSDLKRFKALTMGKPLILGRRTFESLRRPLPGREIIVVTRDPGFSPPASTSRTSPAEALALARPLAKAMAARKSWSAAAPKFSAPSWTTQRIELTEIALEPEGDAFFPRLDMSQWRETKRETPPRGERDEADFAFVTLEPPRN